MGEAAFHANVWFCGRRFSQPVGTHDKSTRTIEVCEGDAQTPNFGLIPTTAELEEICVEGIGMRGVVLRVAPRTPHSIHHRRGSSHVWMNGRYGLSRVLLDSSTEMSRENER